MTDDVGFGASSTFGGPVPTPTMDRLAKAGLRYTQFHTTALCSPTRAALLTGRNHHTGATGVIMELGTGYPGYNSLMPKSCGTFAEVLRQNGYNTAWFGKNHNVPDWQSSQAGPFDLWPTGLGFEYFYGFIGGDTNQWAPALFEGTKPIEPPHDDKDYYFDEDMADKAIARIRLQHAVAPDKPWLAYYAPGTAHAPHHAPKDWIAKFKGQFDQGWDKVREETLARQKQTGHRPRRHEADAAPEGDPGVGLARRRPEEGLRPDDGGLRGGALARRPPDRPHPRRHRGHGRARQHARHLHPGRQRRQRRRHAAGPAQRDGHRQRHPGGLQPGPRAHGRARRPARPTTTTRSAGRTPWTRRSSGPSRSPRTSAARATAWSSRGRRGSRTRAASAPSSTTSSTSRRRSSRRRACEAPAMLNGVPQKPIEGVSMVYTFDDAKAPSTRRTQYFEMLGNRAIYNDGWVACHHAARRALGRRAARSRMSMTTSGSSTTSPRTSARPMNLAGKEPEKLARAAGAVLDRGRQVQRAAARQQHGRALRRQHPPQPHARPQRVHLLRRA